MNPYTRTPWISTTYTQCKSTLCTFKGSLFKAAIFNSYSASWFEIKDQQSHYNKYWWQSCFSAASTLLIFLHPLLSCAHPAGSGCCVQIRLAGCIFSGLSFETVSLAVYIIRERLWRGHCQWAPPADISCVHLCVAVWAGSGHVGVAFL